MRGGAEGRGGSRRRSPRTRRRKQPTSVLVREQLLEVALYPATHEEWPPDERVQLAMNKGVACLAARWASAAWIMGMQYRPLPLESHFGT